MFNRRKTPEQPTVENPGKRNDSVNDDGKRSGEPPMSTQTSTSRNTAMIGASIKIKGEISGDESLQIDGQVEGQVNLNNHDLTIGDSGKVTADLRAKTIKIHGTVNGDIQGSEMVVVSKTGKVLGNIIAPRVTLEDGAQFKGSIDMSPDESAKSKPVAVKTESHNDAIGSAGNQASSAA
ncbi:MAG: cytoskeletal protein CcmA (bactofilin family) [Limisphaerales bacterium]|jgi:cytoskeletal protein CcmA (bactofilin family)